MEAVVEEWNVVGPAVMADHAAGVFKIAVDVAERQPRDISRQIDGEQEARRKRRETAPKSANAARFDQRLVGNANALRRPGVVSEVEVAPQALRNAEKKAQIQRIHAVRKSRV